MRRHKAITLILCLFIIFNSISFCYAEDIEEPVQNETNNEETAYTYNETATSNGVTLKVEWNEPSIGTPTTFHVSATGGSGLYKFRMDAPSYTSPEVLSYESVADPSRGEWMNYTNECSSTDYSFIMTATGTYNFRFYIMDNASKVYYLRTNIYINVSDPNYPSVYSIVQSAVANCNNETDGSDYQKALWLHDWLLTQLDYDKSLKWSSAESALTRGLGTCQAYESAYSKLLTATGIENAETRSTYDGHTWNAIKLDGEWYQVDVTWDDSNDNFYNFDQRRLYFALTDELMAIAHKGHLNIYTADGYATRSTSLANNYFIKSGDASNWAENYRNRIQENLDAGNTEFSIKADNSAFPPSIYGIQNGIIAYAINRLNWSSNGKPVTLNVVTNDANFDFTVTYQNEVKDIGDAIISLNDDFSPDNLSINVEHEGLILKENVDYTMTYSFNSFKSKFKVTLNGINNYNGSLYKVIQVYSKVGESMNEYALNLQGLIEMYFHFYLTDELKNDPGAYVLFELPNGREKKQYIKDTQYIDGLGYRFTCGLYASEMTQKVNFTFVNSKGEKSQTYSRSVEDYTKSIFSKDIEAYKKVTPLLKSMLNYGGYAQIMFHNNESDLAYKDVKDELLSSMNSIILDELQQYKFVKSGSDSSISFKEYALDLKEATSIRIYIILKNDEIANTYKAYVDGNEIDIKQDNRGYYIEVPSIPSNKLDVMHTVVCGGLEFKVSALSWVRSIINKGSSVEESTLNVAESIYLYWNESKKYFG